MLQNQSVNKVARVNKDSLHKDIMFLGTTFYAVTTLAYNNYHVWGNSQNLLHGSKLVNTVSQHYTIN